MISNQSNSPDERPSSSEITNDSVNDTFDNQNGELFSDNRRPRVDASEESPTSQPIRDGKVPKPDDERKLFVGQLSSEITKEDLEKYFAQFGTIEDVTIKYDVPGGRARGFAFILFDQKDSIQKVLNVQAHTINQCQIDPKPAHRRPPVTNPVKKIFIGQLPVDFVEQDLSDYFSQFGIIDTIELPMDREKSVRRPFGFVSFASEKTAEEVLRQQRHSVNGASIEVRPAKPRPHEQQHAHMQQQYPYGDYMLPSHLNTMLVPSMSASALTQSSIIGHHANHNAFFQHNNQHYAGQVDQWSQGANSNGTFWNGNNGDARSNNQKSRSTSQWSTGNNTLGNSIPSSSTVYHPNVASAYSASNYSSSIRPSYNLSPSQSSANIYATGYPPSLAILPPNDLQSSSWNPYAAMPTAANLANGTHPMNYDPNVYYAPYYGDMYGQPYYPAQPAAEQNLSPNGFAPSTAAMTNAGAEKTYQPVSR